MQPYQQAAEVTRRSGELPLNALKYAGGVALGAAGSMIARNAISKIVPLLNDFVPESFAKKALGKIDPRIDKFVKKAESEGFDFNEVKDFLNNKIEKSQSKEETKEHRNIIEQYSPELYKYIEQQVKNGRSFLEAGGLATLEKKFNPIIKNIERDHKTNWSTILQSIFGGKGQQMPQPEQGQMQASIPEQQPMQQSQGAGQGQQALMAILQKIQQSRGIQ